MSAQTMSDVFAPIEARYHAQIMEETWGHLAPKKNVIYRGKIVFALGIFGSDDLNPTVIHCELKNRSGEDLEGSPWFYDAVMEFLGEGCRKPGFEKETVYHAGNVYQFTGFFRNYVFEGTVKQVWPRDPSLCPP